MNTVIHEIPFARPEFDAAELRVVGEVLSSGWVTQGPAVARFEEMFESEVLQLWNQFLADGKFIGASLTPIEGGDRRPEGVQHVGES